MDQEVHTRQNNLTSTGVSHKSAITDHVTVFDQLPNWNDINITKQTGMISTLQNRE